MVLSNKTFNFWKSIVIFLIFISSKTSFCQSKWEWRNPLPQGNDLFDMAYGNNRFVAGGIIGTLISSADGKNWILHNTGWGKWFEGIIFADNRFVAVGDNGLAITSPDGINWTYHDMGIQETFLYITYIDKRYIATGACSEIMESTNGATWSVLADVDITDLEYVGPLAYGNNIYIALPTMKYGSNLILTSPDLATWTIKDITPQSTSNVLYTGNQFLVSGSEEGKGVILTSSDGFTWTTQYPGTVGISKIKYENNHYFALDSYYNKILKSPDAINWTIHPSNSKSHTYSLSWGKDIYVAVGACGDIMTSPNGEDWTHAFPDNIVNEILNIVYTGDMFVATSKGYYEKEAPILTSKDGISWSKKDIGFYGALWGIAYSDGQLTVVGDSGVIFTSTDAFTWSRVNSGTDKTLYSTTWGNNNWVAAGDDFILTSPDGKEWTERPLGSCSGLRSVSYTNDLFIASGYGDTVLTSPDGITWKRRDTGISNFMAYFTCASYAGDLYVIAGYERIITTRDFIEWKEHPMKDIYIEDMTYANNHFVGACGWGDIVVSPDGENWQFITKGLTWYRLNGIAHDDKQFIAVGRDGVILSSPFDVTSIRGKSSAAVYATKRFYAHINTGGIRIKIPQSTGENIRCELFDISGRKISSIIFPGGPQQVTIPAANLGAGVYLVSIMGSNGVKETMRVVVR